MGAPNERKRVSKLRAADDRRRPRRLHCDRAREAALMRSWILDARTRRVCTSKCGSRRSSIRCRSMHWREDAIAPRQPGRRPRQARALQDNRDTRLARTLRLAVPSCRDLWRCLVGHALRALRNAQRPVVPAKSLANQLRQGCEISPSFRTLAAHRRYNLSEGDTSSGLFAG